MAEEEPSAQPPQPRAEAQAPLCGQGVLPPFSAGLPAYSPAPLALPRATAPAAGGAKLTYLEPDKQEPLGHGSQSPPRVTGAATANGRRCQEPLRPIQLLAGLRAPSRPQPMGTSGRRAPAARPPTPSSTTSQEAGRGRLAGVPAGWDSGSRPDVPRGPGAAGAASEGVELRPPPCGPAPRFGWGLAVLLFELLSSCL